MRCIRARAGVRFACFASVLGVALCLVPSSARACSFAWFGWTRSPRTTAFVGTALADSLPAGWGRWGSLRYPLQFLLTRGHTAHGQVVRVDELSRAAPPAVAAAVARGGGTVVLVPWGVSALTCRRSPFLSGGRWLEPGTHGFFTVELRDPTEWLSGKPTFDVFPAHTDPYPRIAHAMDMYSSARPAASGDSILSASEMLSLYDVLPSTVNRDEPAAIRYAAVWRWAAENPRLAERWPAQGFIRQTRISAHVEPEEHRVRAVRSPVAGTYRFVYRFASGDSLIVSARSPASPETALWSLATYAPSWKGADQPARAPGYQLVVRAARSAWSLPSGRFAAFDRSTEGYFNVAEEPSTITNDSTVWRAGFELLRIPDRILRDDPATTQLEFVSRTMSDMRMAAELGLTPGRLVRYADGRVRFEEVVRRGGSVLVTIRGERVSDETLVGRAPR